MYKITLTEFFESNNIMVIHCDTAEKANRLLRAFDKMGKTWIEGKSYLEENRYSEFENETCYGSSGYYCSLEFSRIVGHIIYEFDEVDLEEEDEVDDTLIVFHDFFMTSDCIVDEEDEYSIRSVTLNEKKKITTVVFADGDVKMVKCGEYDTYSPEMGITYCITLKATGKSKTQYKKMINKLINKE